MARAKWKGPYVEKELLNKIFESTQNKKQNYIKTHSKESYIMPFFVDLNFQIYNGKKYIKLKINEDMIGYKLGEFIATKSTRK